jgi:hypothetical protein
MNISGACCAIYWAARWRSGLLPNDETLVGGMVSAICFGNANRYFALPAAGNCERCAMSEGD